MSTETNRAVGRIAAAWPRVQMGKETVAAYVWALEDLSDTEVRAASAWAIRTQTFPPSPAELRRYVVEQRLQLPGTLAALTLVNRYVTQEPTTKCPDCDGSGIVDVNETRTHELVGTMGVGSPCARCGATGGVPNTRRPQLPETLRSVLDALGGAQAWSTSEQPDALRREFSRLYDHAREDAIRQGMEGDLALAAPDRGEVTA